MRRLRSTGSQPALADSMGLDWSDLLAALGLCLVIEGVIPFLSPNSIRRALGLLLTQENWRIRVIGVVSMAAGLIVLYLARH